MLTKMYLTNFLSFKDRSEFDFTPSKYSILEKTNVFEDDVLKGALVIGPNASGKSNVLKGISFIIQLVKGEGVSFENYRCIFAQTPFTAVEYEFLFSGKKVFYKIEYNVITKTIYENLTIDAVTILHREGTRGELRIGDSVIVDSELDSETLFLRTASFNTGRFPQEPTLRELMDFLFNSYYVDGYNQSARTGKTITKYAEENGVDKLNKYLSDFNYDFYVEYASKSEGEGITAVVGSDQKIIFFKRKSFPIPNLFYSESQGNCVFVDMLPLLVNVIENPGMLIFDEFGNSLHNKLAEKIVKFFMRNTKDSQMFVSSHHTNLISHSIYRPDQINLVTFKGSLGSKAQRLSQYKPREAQNIEKMYLGGMFEGLPVYEEVQD